MDGNYEKLLDRVSRVSGLEKEEIDRRVNAKQAKLSGLISKEGALQVIAAELGINFDNEKFKIDELVPGLKKVNITGQIIKLFPIRNFTTKKGEEGRVANIIIADDTSNIKVVLWDTNHIGLIESGTLSEGSVVEIVNGSMRMGEVHLGSFSEFKPSSEIFSNLVKEKVSRDKTVGSLNIGDSAKVRAFIVQVFEPKFFYVCPECKKKASQNVEGFFCVEHGKVSPEKRALMNVILDDGSGTIRSVAFNDVLPKLGLTDFENLELLSQQRQNLLGKELIFTGNVKMNSYFNNPEFSIESIDDVDLDALLKKLDK
ncbi:Replication factor A [uncultured archaeon]|nr:Replication factor A [uncultured archaeon]